MSLCFPSFLAFVTLAFFLLGFATFFEVGVFRGDAGVFSFFLDLVGVLGGFLSKSKIIEWT